MKIYIIYISPTQKNILMKFRDTLHRYYVKGNNSYTTLMGYVLDIRDSMSLLDVILYTQHYTPKDKEQLNEIRSMYISITYGESELHLPYP